MKNKRKVLIKNPQLCLMCVPAVLLVFVLNYLPMGGIVLAFKKYRYDLGIFKSPWNGLNNFKYFFTSQDAWMILRNTIGINLISIFLGLIVALSIALMMNEIRKKIAVKIYQTLLFFPYFLSWIIVSYMLYSFLSTQYGMLNQLLEATGQATVQWYMKAEYWPVILILAGIWKGMGYGAVIYYAALMGIDSSYYEAALIDGASRMQLITKISIPLLKPVIVVNLLLQVGRIMYADFGLFYFLPRQSPLLYSTTTVIDTYVYNALISTGDIGIGAATGLFQSVVGLVLILLANYAARKVSRESALF